MGTSHCPSAHRLSFARVWFTSWSDKLSSMKYFKIFEFVFDFSFFLKVHCAGNQGLGSAKANLIGTKRERDNKPKMDGKKSSLFSSPTNH